LHLDLPFYNSQMNWSEQARRQRLQILHILWCEPFSETQIQQLIAGKALSRQSVDREVPYDYTYVVSASALQLCDFDFVGWMPHRAR
jgi:hypothetical protein